MGNNLELLPLSWKHWKTGDTIELQVKAKGTPAIGTQVALINSMTEDNQGHVLKEADSEGKVVFTFEKPDFYLLMAKYTDKDDVKDGYYDFRNYTTTLHILVK